MTDSATQLVITDTFSTLVTDFNTVSSDLGATGDLNTGVKTNIVASINELESDLFNVEGADKRTLSSLTTTDKTCIVDAINELDLLQGNVALGTDASTVTGAIAEIEGVFDASAFGISAGSSAFDITTTHASGISLAAPVVSLTGDLTLVDGEQIKLGTGADLTIHHTGVHARLINNTGNTDIRSDGQVTIETVTGTEEMAVFNANGSVDLYHNDVKRFETTADGIDVTGTVTLDDTLTVEATSGFGTLEVGGPSGGYIDLKGPMSDDHDLRITTTGTASTINAKSGTLNLQRDGSTKLQVLASGVNVTGTLNVNGGADVIGQLELSSHLDMPDNAEIRVGTGDDLILLHDATNSIIKGDSIYIKAKSEDENMASFTYSGGGEGSVNLYHNGSSKFATTSGGVSIPDDLELGADSIIKSGGNAAITFANANVTMGGNATVSGTLSVGSLTTTNPTVRLAINELHGEVSTNTGNISTNTTAISANTSARNTNATAITANTTNITNNDSDISANASAIAANTTNITNNDSDISANTTNITTNSSAIGTLNLLDSDIVADGNLVAAINELQGDIRQINSSTGNANQLVGTLAQLTTSAKNNCVVAINELDSDIGVINTTLSNVEANADVTDTANVVAALTAGTNITIASNGTISSTDTQRAIHSSPSENANTTSISSGWAFDNVKTAVPLNAVFTDNNTEYSTATSSTLGLVKIGYTENGKNYPVELASGSGKMFVNVPWNSDTNTQNAYQTSVVSSGGIKLRLSGTGHDGTTTDDVKFVGAGATTVSTPDASTITITSTDTNTTYTVGDGGLTQKNFTTTLFNKLNGIDASADVNVYNTASDLLNALKTVDTNNSGLNAATLDGNEGSHYATATSVTTNTSNISTNTSNISTNTSAIGTLSSLTTSEQNNLVLALNELKLSVPLIYAADGTTVLN